MSMNIEANEGEQVVFTAQGGYEIEKVFACSAGLILNQTYTVQAVAVSSFSSKVYLKEFPYTAFNTCLFEDVNHANLL